MCSTFLVISQKHLGSPGTPNPSGSPGTLNPLQKESEKLSDLILFFYIFTISIFLSTKKLIHYSKELKVCIGK